MKAAPRGEVSKLRALCHADPDAARDIILKAMVSHGGHARQAAATLRDAGWLREDAKYLALRRCVLAVPGLDAAIVKMWGAPEGRAARRNRESIT